MRGLTTLRLITLRLIFALVIAADILFPPSALGGGKRLERKARRRLLGGGTPKL